MIRGFFAGEPSLKRSHPSSSVMIDYTLRYVILVSLKTPIADQALSISKSQKNTILTVQKGTSDNISVLCVF